MLTDMFQQLWTQVREERREKLERAVEQMLASDTNQGILVVENQFGVILSADLNLFVPFGEIRFVREDVNLDRFTRLVSPPEGSGGEA